MRGLIFCPELLHRGICAKSFLSRTSEKSSRNPFRIRTSETKDLKSFRIRTYRKKGEGALPNPVRGRHSGRIAPVSSNSPALTRRVRSRFDSAAGAAYSRRVRYYGYPDCVSASRRAAPDGVRTRLWLKI